MSTTQAVTLKAETVTDEHGRPLHTNLNFGGRFGNSAIYHALSQSREKTEAQIADRLDRQAAFHRGRGTAVEIERREYINPLIKKGR